LSGAATTSSSATLADLITHAALAVLVKARRGSTHTPAFLAGTLLPDLLGRVPGLTVLFLRGRGLPLPDALAYLWEPFHLPLGMALVAYLLSRMAPPERRAGVGRNLLGGGALHLAVDLLQRHLGTGYMIFFPFSTVQVELGWLGSEDTVFLAPPLALAAALAAWRRWGPPRRGSPPPAPG
jgi:hypothetical protein